MDDLKKKVSRNGRDKWSISQVSFRFFTIIFVCNFYSFSFMCSDATQTPFVRRNILCFEKYQVKSNMLKQFPDFVRCNYISQSSQSFFFDLLNLAKFSEQTKENQQMFSRKVFYLNDSCFHLYLYGVIVNSTSRRKFVFYYVFCCLAAEFCISTYLECQVVST